MLTTGPFTLTQGAEASYPDPYATGGPTAVNVQLQNQSPYVLTVLAAGEQFTVQAFSAQTVPIQSSGGASIAVTPEGSTGSVATNGLYLVWLLRGEQSETPDGSFSITSVDIGTIAAGQVIEVINSPGAYVATQSTASAASVSLTPASGGGTASQSVTIPTTPVMHAALVSGVYTITAASNQSIQIQVVGNNTNTIYYNFDNLTTSVTNQAIPEAVIAISAADTALVVSHVSGGGTQSSVINLNFYSQAIPPDPYVAALITQGLFGTTAETVINPLVSPPLLQSVYNTQISTNWGIKVADSLAPADTATVYNTAGVTGNTTIYTPSTNVVLKRVVIQGNSGTANTLVNLLTNGPNILVTVPTAFPYGADYDLGDGIFIPSGQSVSLFTQNTWAGSVAIWVATL